MDYVNVEKKKKDFINATDDKKHSESGFRTFNRFLRRWAAIRPPVRMEFE